MILFYDDSPVFGGHEVMTIHAVAGLVADPSAPPVTFFAHPENPLLLAALHSLQSTAPDRLFIESAPLPPRKPIILGSLLRRSAIRLLADRIRHCAPDLFVAVQGDIAISVLGLLAAKLAGIPTVSYIPVPHPLSEMGAKFGAFRDRLDSSLLFLPDAFITISYAMAAKLARRTRGQKAIDVVYNGIDPAKFHPVPKSAARSDLALPPEATIIAQAGRIEFNQKRQNFLLSSFAENPLPDPFHLLFVGQGPDLENLQSQARSSRISHRISFLPWQENLAKVYSAADLLVIPSRFEGFPLVMLESIRCQTPVAAADLDGMAEFLPHPWRFNPGNQTDCLRCITSLLASDNSADLATLNHQIDAEMTLGAFQKNFAAALFRRLPAGVSTRGRQPLTSPTVSPELHAHAARTLS